MIIEMTISDLYETPTPEPELPQALEVKVTHVGGAQGKKLAVEVNLEEAALDAQWNGNGSIFLTLTYKNISLAPSQLRGNLGRFGQADLLVPGRSFILEARGQGKKARPIGSLEFNLVSPPAMKKRGRIAVIQQLVERTVNSVPSDPGWKKLLPWRSKSPLEAKFDAAAKAILGEGRSLVPQLSGVDIAIALCGNAQLKSWLILVPKDVLVEKMRGVEDKAHEAGIRDFELITNRMVKLLFE